MRLLLRSSRRWLLGHPGQLGLSVLGIALGVAVVVAMDLAVQSSREAFRISSQTVAGRATHHVLGGPTGLPDGALAALRLDAGIREAAPVVEGWVTVPGLGGRPLRVLGVDVFSEVPFRPYLIGREGGLGVAPLLTEPRGVVLAAGTGREAGVGPGDTLRVVVDGRDDALVVVGLVEPESELGRRGLRDLLVMDVAGAQELLERVGRLDRVDLALPSGAEGDSLLAKADRALPASARVEPAGTRTRTMSRMIRAFDLNLTALSLLALVFGVFLIYNTMTFSVVQRRDLLGTYRALGVTRGQVLGLILGEAALLGIAGTALGLLLGVVLGRGLVDLVTRTINDLYFVLTVQGLAVSPAVLLKGGALGVGATLLAALAPAREAVGATPRSAMTRSYVEARARRGAPRAALVGLALGAAGAGLLVAPGRSVVVSFAGLFAVILGMALLTPLGTVAFVRAVRPAMERTVGILGTMAARGVAAALSRTGPAVAALMVAVSVTVGLGIMIGSFRHTLVRWLDGTLQADVYVSVPSTISSRARGTLDPAVVEVLSGVEGVAGTSTYRASEFTGRYGLTRLVALDLDPRGEAAFDLKEGHGEPVFEAFRRRGALLVSEPFAYRHRLGVGDRVTLPTGSGPREFPVAGVFYDYGSERGTIMMARTTYDRFWDDPAVTSLGIFAGPGVGADALVARLREALEEREGSGAPSRQVVIRSNRALRAASLEVFDRTFAITGVLRALAFAVAFIGTLAALMALQLERGRELGVLRANGMTPGQVWHLVTSQTGLMGLAAGLMAIPAGLVLAGVMIFVVNRRSFGWTLTMEVGPEILLQAVGLALAGALLAGLYPAWKMSRTSPALALREE